jgi:membrane protein DedA with SNARE-associated domain
VWNIALIGAGAALGDQWDVVGDYVGVFQWIVIIALIGVAVWFVWSKFGARRTH